MAVRLLLGGALDTVASTSTSLSPSPSPPSPVPRFASSVASPLPPRALPSPSLLGSFAILPFLRVAPFHLLPFLRRHHVRGTFVVKFFSAPLTQALDPGTSARGGHPSLQALCGLIVALDDVVNRAAARHTNPPELPKMQHCLRGHHPARPRRLQRGGRQETLLCPLPAVPRGDGPSAAAEHRDRPAGAGDGATRLGALLRQ